LETFPIPAELTVGVLPAPSATIPDAMEKLTRRHFFFTVAAATFVSAAAPSFAAARRQRVFVGPEASANPEDKRATPAIVVRWFRLPRCNSSCR